MKTIRNLGRTKYSHKSYTKENIIVGKKRRREENFVKSHDVEFEKSVVIGKFKVSFLCNIKLSASIDY